MKVLKSYLQGEWVSGTGAGRTLYNAVNAEPIATASSEGLDLNAALSYARTVGGASLRAMSFAERGALLKEMSRVIHEARDELIALGQENSGNTRGDAKFDVDGASGTLSYYAYLGKSLGSAHALRDGEPEKLLRSSRLVGQHIKVPRRGVAVHINAFNFPAWGLCEKAAVAILAGVPVLSKPGTTTAVVAVRAVQLWVDAGILPAGVLSLLTGSVGDLLDHLDYQDCVAFTGSGATGARVRGHANLLKKNIPVNIEADSLNASVLGPDVKPGSDTYWMFIADVLRDMTQKCGQKCTAVRRILVPQPLIASVVADLSERLSDTPIGDPTLRVNRIGPVATEAQRRSVCEGIDALGKESDCVWSAEAIPEGGYYVRPHLFLSSKGAEADYVHAHEVFGPVATILSWEGDADEAVNIVAKGGGGLVASLYTDDRRFAKTVLLGLAPWTGRLFWGSKKIHDQSPGPGTVLPNLTHGGPGKAGGGQELGGLRGLDFYMQRTAIQGDRALLEKVLADL